MRTFVLAAAVATMLSPVALAAETSPIVVASPWLRATPKGAPVAGGYATITNNGAIGDRLIGASLPIAPTGEVHSMTVQNGIMHMARLHDGLAIAPGATVTLSPGGYHLMFLKPTSQLKAGQAIRGTLTFAKAGSIPVTFEVAGMAAKAAPGQNPKSMDTMPGMDMH